MWGLAVVDEGVRDKMKPGIINKQILNVKT